MEKKLTNQQQQQQQHEGLQCGKKQLKLVFKEEKSRSLISVVNQLYLGEFQKLRIRGQMCLKLVI